MKNKELKKIQRTFNTIMRKLNQNIEKDDLWRGRFEVRQINRSTYAYSDHSGYSFVAHVRFVDKKTGQFYEKAIDCFSGFFANKSAGWHLWEGMNYFITEVVKVWEEEPDISTQRVDYTRNKKWTKRR